METYQDNSKKIAYIYIAICLAMTIFFVLYLGFIKSGPRTNVSNQPSSELATMVATAGTEQVLGQSLDEQLEETSLKIGFPEKNIDWAGLESQDSDVYAWIYVPNTMMDYPIYQSVEGSDENYYLDHNADGSEGYPGCIYSQYTKNAMDFMDSNTVLYGHNMKNGTMFAGIHDFKDQGFFDNNNYMYIYLPNGQVFTYAIFACYSTDDSLIGYEYDFGSDIGFASYINDIKTKKSVIKNINDGIINAIGTNSKILTLSTCFTHGTSKRLLLQGVMVNQNYIGQ